MKDEGGKLTLTAGRLSDLDHWHFDTFKATSRTPARTAALVSFRLSGQGTVAALNLPGFRSSGAGRRLPGRWPLAASSQRSRA